MAQRLNELACAMAAANLAETLSAAEVLGTLAQVRAPAKKQYIP